MKNIIGAFGKIPSLGDFFSLNIDHSIVEVLDNWMQSGLLEVSRQLGSRWDECYMSAPIWRFALCEGVFSEFRILGIMMPSVDRVGRKFPLLLITLVDNKTSIFFDHQRNIPLYEELEDIALMTLEDESTRDNLIGRLNLIKVESPSNISGVTTKDNIFVTTGNNINEITELLAAEFINLNNNMPCIWSSVSEAGEKMFVSDGLPVVKQMRMFYDLGSDIWTKEFR